MLKEDSVELHILIGCSDRLGENANGLWKGHVVMGYASRPDSTMILPVLAS
jgi:hypothetical protein